MRKQLFFNAIVAGALVCMGTSANAQDTIFGKPGSGQPTRTVVGILSGAAAGTAIGQGVGGKDGWWIGSLVGSTVGGLAGNQWGAADARKARTAHHGPSSYRPRYPGTRVVETVYAPRPQPRVVQVQCPQPTRLVVKSPAANAPYGFLSGGNIKSPWSDFTMSVGGKTSGQIIYDPNTGNPFRVP